MSYLTIYFEDKPVFLCDEIIPTIKEYQNHPDTIYIDQISTTSVHSLLNKISKSQFRAGVVFGKNFLKLKTDFFKHFTLIKAAGGIVNNEKDEVLMIFRRDKWDLPKGKLDEGESIEECAIREVREETGLKELQIIKPIEITYHTYKLFGKHILKETHWYAMKANGNEKLIPQTEEEITGIIWVKKSGLEKYFSNSYPTIVDILKKIE
ncbi:MAG TPA: NUDIX hydrolase [Hanamia sp.]|nr:NUDIX hydrolase [Hanamia sp.]